MSRVIVGLSSLVSSSSTPVTVTVCTVFQLELVNVRLLVSRDAAPVSLLLSDTVTLAPGFVASAISRSAVLPSSTDTDAGVTTRPRSSSSVAARGTSTSARPS